METVNERLRWLRADLGLSQRKFADQIGMTQTGLSGMEQPGKQIAEKTIKLICSTFGVREAWLRDGVGDPYQDQTALGLQKLIDDNNLSQQELAFIRAFAEFPPEKRAIVLEFAEFASERVRLLAKPKPLTEEQAHVALQRQLDEEKRPAGKSEASGSGV